MGFDLNTKCNAARKFIEKGDKVKVSLRFRGREMAHIDSSKHILEDFAEKLSDIAVVDKAPKLEGRSMTSTPDYAFPNQASLVQAKLKAVNAMCFDVSAACSGFITALDIAASMLKTGSYKYAL